MSLLGLSNAYRERWDLRVAFYRSTLLAHARNTLVSQAIGAADVVVQIDSDQVFEPDDVRQLVQPVLDGRAHVVGAPVAKRGVDWGMVHEAVLRGVPAHQLCRHAGGVNVSLLAEDLDAMRLRYFEHAGRRYVRVRSVGCGAMAASASALRSMAALAPVYHPPPHRAQTFDLHQQGAASALGMPGTEGLEYIGEDTGLCLLAQQAGIAIYCAVDTDVGHRAGYDVFRQSFLAEFQRHGFTLAPEAERALDELRARVGA